MRIKQSAVIILTVLLTFGLSSLAAAENAAPEKSKQVLEGKLNINTATVKELKMLPGIGKKTASNIVEYRTRNGNFTTIKSLLKVNGLGKKTLEKTKGYIIFEGETTLAKKKA